MDVDAASAFNDQKEKLNTFLEIANTEKQLLTSIYSKGLVHKDVQELYRRARSSYENIILNNYEVVGLQEVEFSLWKLHYKHIDEFRKRIRQANAEKRKSEAQEGDSSAAREIDNHMEGLKSFLSEATEFYQELTKKLRKSCGLPRELLLCKNGSSSLPLLPMKLPQCQYACHRFLICLGDLARYGELCKKPDACTWSFAATYYFEASRIWPDSGNPHNQLALLATYIGDPFLALYHCIRSLAVKEPFPDAWNNLMLLFEENRLSNLHSLSSGAHLDLLKPSVWCSMDAINGATSGSSNKNMPEAPETVTSGKADIWLLFVRLMSFFLVHTSLENFQSTLASTVRQLEGLVVMDGDELKAALESYQLMDPSRKGPYCALQLVSIFIFIFHSLTESGDGVDPKKDNKQQSALTQLAVAATFICIGRLVEKTVARNNTQTCPLLPTVCVFVEWLVNVLDRAEAHARDEKVQSAMSYFFGALADLLNRLDPCENGLASENSALWEDHELKGFDPLAHAHKSLDFTSHLESIDNFNNKSVCRSRRIFCAATKLADRSSHLRKWISHDKTGKRFYIMESELADKEKSGVAESGSTLQLKGSYQNNCGMAKENGESQDHPCRNSQSITTDEEEVILFKPITRHNSAPIYTSGTSCDQSSINVVYGTTPSDESLRRATSLISEQSQPQNDIFSFRPENTNLRYSKPLKQSAAFPAGPPSLSAWVLEKESPRNERGTRDLNKHQLSPIDELASESLSDLSLKETRDHKVCSMPVSAAIHDTPPPYISPVPSAPLLPEDASWFKGNTPLFPNKSAFGTKEGDGILGASPVSGYSSPSTVRGPLDFVAGGTGFVEGYPPLLGMSSSEWLYHYRNSQNFERVSNPVWPVHSNAPANYGNLNATNLTRFDVLDQWGNHLASSPMVYLESPQLHPSPPLAYGAEEQRTDKHFLGYQRASPYVCGTGMDLRSEQPTLLNYLKERERQIPPESQFKGPNFMGN
ncbi:nonsense-mediated mRNA decay factor SMG7-like [Nicotiana sylvestris]|uniref:Protein SMG7L n=2 Tax=Nicotiana TaxID=4085 RepID=A0A1S4CPB2_TOBAC|nr:PREDICTED: protein SMG7L [Nicotiana sylvestris]XP_009802465.1 PREDICTED: protein SMG7L [Nicotiana sylvestris]XP_009802466.1 PREDICTED: protein SMG7L [Nicotiana sylvestris]XP_016503097.1 PREDICTED: protein SMG7L-like [Nicotiana tabacum]